MQAKKNWVKLTMAIAGILFLIGISSAQAMTVVRDTNTATNILNLKVGDTLYNVDFLSITGNDLYGDPPTKFDFTSEVAAAEALDQVNAALNTDPLAQRVGPAFGDSLPFYFIGFDAETENDIDFIVAAMGAYREDAWVDLDFDPLQSRNSLKYADFQVVPIPAAVWLLGGGLIGLIGLRKRFKR